LNKIDFLDINFIDIVDILLVALLLFYAYRLIKGTVAINIFIGIVIFYVIWKLTDILNLDVLSNILGKFISVGFFALIVVFQQEIRKFLLLIGSTNFASRRNVIRYFKFLNQDQGSLKVDLTALLSACNKMASEKTGAIIVMERENNLDFLKNSGDEANIEISTQILETIFFKNSPLHDGAIIVKTTLSRPLEWYCLYLNLHPYPQGLVFVIELLWASVKKQMLWYWSSRNKQVKYPTLKMGNFASSKTRKTSGYC
jgi:diadenylate cyclase